MKINYKKYKVDNKTIYLLYESQTSRLIYLHPDISSSFVYKLKPTIELNQALNQETEIPSTLFDDFFYKISALRDLDTSQPQQRIQAKNLESFLKTQKQELINLIKK